MHILVKLPSNTGIIREPHEVFDIADCLCGRRKLNSNDFTCELVSVAAVDEIDVIPGCEAEFRRLPASQQETSGHKALPDRKRARHHYVAV